MNCRLAVGALRVRGAGVRVDERRLQTSGGEREEKKEAERSDYWETLLMSFVLLSVSLPGWSGMKAGEERGGEPRAADGGPTMEAFCPPLHLLLDASLYQLHHLSLFLSLGI